MRAGLIGLGNMGRGMALTLQRKTLPVTGFDLAESARAALRAEGIAVAATIGEVAASVDIILLSLPKAEHVESVIAGPGGIAETGRSGLIVVDTTTSTPECSRRMSAILAERGIAFIDAPVSGGPKAAHAGTMTMVIGGNGADIARATPVLEAISAKRVHVGAVGAGHATKLVNNLLCAAHLLTAAEALRIIDAAGLDRVSVMQGINASSGRSGVTEINLPNWVLNEAFNSGFTMQLMRKDVALAADMIAGLGLSLPVAAETARLWAESAPGISDGEDFNRIIAHPLNKA